MFRSSNGGCLGSRQASCLSQNAPLAEEPMQGKVMFGETTGGFKITGRSRPAVVGHLSIARSVPRFLLLHRHLSQSEGYSPRVSDLIKQSDFHQHSQYALENGRRSMGHLCWNFTDRSDVPQKGSGVQQHSGSRKRDFAMFQDTQGNPESPSSTNMLPCATHG